MLLGLRGVGARPYPVPVGMGRSLKQPTFISDWVGGGGSLDKVQDHFWEYWPTSVANFPTMVPTLIESQKHIPL